MNKYQFFNFFRFLKNPLWIIVILLIVMNFLLWDISQRIGHHYIYSGDWQKQITKEMKEQEKAAKEEGVILPTGLYRTIYNLEPEIPYYDEKLEKIMDKLDDIYWKL